MGRRFLACFLCVSLARASQDEQVSRLFGSERNLSEAAKYMALGAEKGCGRCFFYLGAMLALGEPETNLSARFKVLPGGNIEFRWARGLSRAEGLPAAVSMLDRPAIAYYVGAEKGDPLAVLAFSYYVLNRLTLGSPGAAWWTQPPGAAENPALRRKPWREEATPALCQLILRSLENVAETAARNEDSATDASDLNFFVQNASEVLRAKKEHADWIQARSKDGYKDAKVVEATYLFHGDVDLNVTRNVSRALELFAASSSTTEGAWNSMLLHAREGHESKIIHHAQNIIQDPEATALQKTMAQHYLHRFGSDDTRSNSTRAGVYLLAAAELGDSNAQQMIAHAYAGLDVPELDRVKVPGAPNTKRAMHFYMKAAKQGRPVSAVNAVSLMLRSKEGQRSTADDRCRGAVETLRDVALAYHPEVLQLHGHARRAFDRGDEEGALISFALLSELGAKNAHTNAASLWKKGEKKTLKCWRPTWIDPSGRLCELDYRRRAALTGNVDAMLRLASLHENLGDPNQAQQWIRKASDAGSIEAKHSIAYIQANGPAEDRSNACMEYCKLLKLQDEPVLARGLAFLQVMRLKFLWGEACCDLPVANPVPSKGTIFAIFASTTAGAVCLGLTCMVS